MIVKSYDIGWGANWPMKQLEQELAELASSELTAKGEAIELIKGLIADNGLAYRDLYPIFPTSNRQTADVVGNRNRTRRAPIGDRDLERVET